jgi:POT family proton-dependent oligopeptide transporter
MSDERKHPVALPYLFFSEMWERFGYYLMIGIFFLYLKNVEHGFAMNNKDAADLYGTFIALVFLTPFIGGLIADRYWGYRKSIIIGGLMMGAGYCLMSVHNLPVLYISMTLVIMGNGFFKPNISTYTLPRNLKKEKTKATTFFTWVLMWERLFVIFSAQLL